MGSARRWVVVASLALACTACRDTLTLPEEPLEVLSIAVAQPDVVQGESGVGVTVRVRNDSKFGQPVGAATLSVSVDGVDASAAFALTPDAANPAMLAPESEADLLFALSAVSDAPAGTASTNVTVANGAGLVSLGAPQPATFLVLLHAQLEILSQVADGPACRDGRVSGLRVHVRNTGESTASVASAGTLLTRRGNDVSQEFVVTAAPANPTTIAPGTEADIDVLIAADLLTELGTVDAAVLVGASDARSAVDASPASAAPVTIDVHQPATLAITGVTETRTTVSKGQTGLSVIANVENTGTVPATVDASALAFAIGGTASSADYTVMPPAAGTVIPAGGNADLAFTVTVLGGAASGATAIDASADATDAICGESPSASPAVTPGAWTVQTPAALVASVASSATDSWAGGTTTVTLTVTNTGEASAMAVAPSIAVTSCSTCATLTAVDTTAKNIAGGDDATFEWTAALSVPLPDGQDVAAPSFDASASGSDANTLGAVSSGISSDATTVEALRPIPCFSFTPNAVAKNGFDPFSVDASCSSDVESADAALDVDWDWTNNGSFDDSGLTEMQDYGSAGKKIVAMRVTDEHGRSAETSRTLVVETNGDLGCVTTLVDEDDPGADPASPGGTGFSLREAIDWAGVTSARQTICFDAGLAGETITFDPARGVLPALSSGGVQFAGRRDITIDFGNLPYGFRTRLNSEFYNLRLTGVAPGGIAKIVIGGNSVDIEDCEIFGGGGAGIAWDETQSTGPAFDLDIDGSDIHDNETDGIRIVPLDPNDVEAEIERNHIWDNGGSGIDASSIGNATTVARNLIHGNAAHGVVSGGDEADIVNNTISLNGGDGLRLVDCGCGTENWYWNNVIADNGGFGINAVGTAGASSRGTNWLFGNDLSETNGTVASDATDRLGTSDPQLLPDFTLARASPCRNAGDFIARTPDSNDTGTGSFYGTEVDAGSWESPR